MLEDLAHEAVDVLTRERRDRNDLFETAGLRIAIHQGQQVFLRHAIDFIQQQKFLCSDGFQQLESEFVAAAERCRGIDDKKNQIDITHRVAHGFHHPLVHPVDGLVYARRIQKNDLAFGLRDDSADDVPRGLRLVRDNRYFVADEMIEECRFPRIGTADDRNKS